MLTKEQQRVVEHPAEGILIVTGGPGSGKSYILRARAIELARTGDSVCILVYNRALRDNIKTRLEQADGQNSGVRPTISVLTVHDLARSLFDSSIPCHALPDDLAAKYIREVLESRLMLETDNLSDESVLLCLEQVFSEREQELALTLKRPASEISDVGQLLLKQMLADGVFPVGAVLPFLAFAIKKGYARKWDHLLVDECQDFPESFVRGLWTLAHVSLTIAYDRPQSLQIADHDVVLGVIKNMQNPHHHINEIQLSNHSRDVHGRTGATQSFACTKFAEGQLEGALLQLLDDGLPLQDPDQSSSSLNLYVGILVDDGRIRRWAEQIADSWDDGRLERNAASNADIIVTTLTRAKGLEFDITFAILSAPPTSSAVAQSLLYLLTTRTRKQLNILIAEEVYEAWVPHFARPIK